MGEHSAISVHEFPALGPPTHILVDVQPPLGFDSNRTDVATPVVIGMHLVPTVMRMS
jgi:hypothetical protein